MVRERTVFQSYEVQHFCQFVNHLKRRSFRVRRLNWNGWTIPMRKWSVGSDWKKYSYSLVGESQSTMMSRCFRGRTTEKTSDNVSIGDSIFSSLTILLTLSSKALSSGMETCQSLRSSASTCSKATCFSCLIYFLRVPTDSVLAILTGNMCRRWRSSPWTKQLSSRTGTDGRLGGTEWKW